MPTRPNPVRWLGYAWGVGLPERHREWVYKDVTTRTWLLRHLARHTVQVAPFIALILIFLPGAFWIRLVAVIGGYLLSILFSFSYVVETGEHRLAKAGFPVGTGEQVRSERALRNQQESARRYRERVEARRARG
jgi:hypothetical protein